MLHPIQVRFFFRDLILGFIFFIRAWCLVSYIPVITEEAPWWDQRALLHKRLSAMRRHRSQEPEDASRWRKGDAFFSL